RLVQRQDGDQATVGVTDMTDVEPPPLGKNLGPVMLPGPAEKRATAGGRRRPGIPSGGLRGGETGGRLRPGGGHRASDGLAASRDSPAPDSPAPSPSPLSASLIASSTAESKSSPSSSPNSLPIFFMKRATLAGSFSSRSPSPPPSASDSRRASSDLTVANRAINRVSVVDRHRRHAGGSAPYI